MKIVLEFSPSPDNNDAFEFTCAQRGQEYRAALSDIAAAIRTRLKYDQPSADERATLEALRDLIPDLDQG